MRRDRGAALILALGILALLTMLVVSFALLTQVETSAAANYREGERARTIAKSGLERAQAELRRAVTTPGYPMPWLQYDEYDYEKSKRFDLGAHLAAVTQGQSLLDIGLKKTGTGPGVDGTKSPSLGMFFGTEPQILANDNSLPWPSGCVGATYYSDPANPMFRGDYYTLRITDSTSRIYINDENANIADMIDNLVWAWGTVAGQSTAPGLGAAILSNRPADGYRRTDELATIPTLTAGQQVQLKGILPYLTAVSRVDQKVVELGKQQGRSRYPYLSIQPRAAVNVNTAPYPVLVACFAGIAARGGSPKIDQSTADKIAKAIIKYRENPSLTDETTGGAVNQAGNPASQRWGFQHWGEFKVFLTNGGVGPGLSEQLADLVLANANPNTDLNKFVPDDVIDHAYDKNDLDAGTTELCFGSNGVFIIESLGVVLDPVGKPIATAKARAVVRAFERYVETTQADFEAGRIDSPGQNGLVGLRDICSLPESRNALDAKILGDLSKDEKAPGGNAGMHCAEYDGQLTFNAITHSNVTNDIGIYVGFIDRTLDGTKADGSMTATIQHAGGARVDRNRTVAIANDVNQTLSLVLDDGNPTNPDPSKRHKIPNFWNGTDLHPLAAVLGREDVDLSSGVPPTTVSSNPSSGRELQWDQDDVVIPEDFTATDFVVSAPVDQDINATFSPGGTVGPIGKVHFVMQETVTSWEYHPILHQGFELWFKPARRHDAANTVVLLDWHGQGSQKPIATTEDTLLDYDAITINNPSNNPPINNGTVWLGGVVATFNADFYDATVPGTVATPSHQNQVNYGAPARFIVWLEKHDATGLTWDLHARFKITKEPGPYDLYDGDYDKTWDYTGLEAPIHTGTWHHLLVSWETPEYDEPTFPPGTPDSVVIPAHLAAVRAAVKGEHSFLFVDGNKIGGQKTNGVGEPDWPTEIQPRGQLVIAAVDNLKDYLNKIIQAELAVPSSGTALVKGNVNDSALARPNPEKYRAPVQLIAGDNMWIGAHDSAVVGGAPDFPEVAGAYRFLGLVDNVCFQSRWTKQINTGQLEASGATGVSYLPRYDTYRPSSGVDNAPNAGVQQAGGFKALVYRKHTQALDWSKPIRIVAYDVTAWKASAAGEKDADASKSADAGRAFFRFGWTNKVPQPDGVNAVPNVPDIDGTYDPVTSPAGWTVRLNSSTGTPWNSVANGYLLPAREPNGRGGFLTRGSGTAAADPTEYTLYAIELYPFAEAQNGPRMAPVVDDVNVVYMRWDTGTVIEEEEVVDTE